MNNKFIDVLKDEDFANEILEMQTTEEVQKAFKEKGIDITIDDIKIIEEIINKMVEKNSTILSEEDLENIGGGKTLSEGLKDIISTPKKIIKEAIKNKNGERQYAIGSLIGLSTILMPVASIAVATGAFTQWAVTKYIENKDKSNEIKLPQ